MHKNKNTNTNAAESKIIFFEANEIPYRVIDDFCQRNPDSSFAELLAVSHQYESYASASRPLEPCFNWPTIHRGIPDQMHGIYDWNMSITEQDQKYPPIWKLLANKGVNVGLFGSLHSHPSFPSEDELDRYKFYMPDIFSADARAYPESISTFQQVNLDLIRKSARNVDSGLEWKGAYNLAQQLPRLGLTASTLMGLGAQIVSEKISPWKKTRRRAHQAKLSFDVFFHLLQKRRPDFSTCFVNHNAAAMHRYWAALYPEHYDVFDMTDNWRKRYKDEIDYSMNTTDKMLEKLLNFVKINQEYTLVLCSGMGQAATIAEHLYTELYITDLSVFMNAMGVPNWSWSPAMFPHFNIRVESKDVARFKVSLDNLKVGGCPFSYTAYPDGQFSLHLGQQDLLTDSAEYRGEKRSLSSLGLHRVTNEDTAQRTGYHVPEGALLVYDPKCKKAKDQARATVSTLSIAPSLLKRFELTRPSYMSEELIQGLIEKA